MLLLTNTIRPADHDQDEICRPHTVPLCCFSHYLLPNTVRFWNTREGEKIKTEHNRPIVWWTTLLDNLSCSFILPSLHPVIHHALLRAQNSYTEGAGNVLVFIIASECELQLWNRLRDVICYCDSNHLVKPVWTSNLFMHSNCVEQDGSHNTLHGQKFLCRWILANLRRITQVKISKSKVEANVDWHATL